jgi:hypothetical protein
MLRRLLVGLVLGLLVGGAVAAGLIAGLGVRTFTDTSGTIFAYLAAAISGVLTGLVAGKPIWASGAKVEAGLKALFGALLGAAAMFATRRWGGWLGIQNLPAIPVLGMNGSTAVGDLPALSLPLVAALLGALFELDNTGDDADSGKGAGATPSRRRLDAATAGKSKTRLPKTPGHAEDEEPDDDAEREARRAKG